MIWPFIDFSEGLRDYDDTPVADWALVYQPGDDEWGHYRSEGPSRREHLLAGVLIIAALFVAVLVSVQAMRGAW